jgi:8-oxo-dGTP diphosphatase
LYTYQYPRPAITIDIVLFQRVQELYRVLLIKRAQAPFAGKYALPGGFVDLNETLEEAAGRELREETGLEDIRLVQIHTFSDLDRDPRERIISTAYGAVIDDDDPILPQAGSDAAEAHWFDLSNLPLLAFDHNIIIQAAIKKMLLPKEI